MRSSKGEGGTGKSSRRWRIASRSATSSGMGSPCFSAARRAAAEAAHEVLETSRRFEPNGLSNEYVMFSPGAIGSSWLSP